jgi:Zn-dependent metalloprotease
LNDLVKEAAIIYHEYAHSVIQTIQPTMGTYEAGALHEGYADYFGCSLTSDPKIGEFVVEQVGKEYWRDLRSPKTYKDFSGTDAHADGEIWGSTCWKIREALGGHFADRLMYKSLYYLPQNATFADACEGIIQGAVSLKQSKTSYRIKSCPNFPARNNRKILDLICHECVISVSCSHGNAKLF